MGSIIGKCQFVKNDLKQVREVDVRVDSTPKRGTNLKKGRR